MEIRSSLRKIDNYLKIVADLNKAILEEGTMAPEELQIMKKYLYVCVERIEDIQIKLGLSVANEPSALASDISSSKEQETVATNLTQPLIQEKNDDETDSEVAEMEHETIMEEENTIGVLNSFIESNIVQEVSEEEQDVSKTMSENDITENIVVTAEAFNQILVEPVICLSADLPSVKYSTGINFSDYEQKILDDETEKVTIVGEISQLTVEETCTNANILVAEDVTTEQERIVFKQTTETETENIKQESESIQKLIQDTEKENLNKLVAENTVKEDLPLKFESKPESEQEVVKTHINLVDTNNEEEFSVRPTLSEHEYESILNKKSLSESIALNDKFIFVRELFGSQFSEYESSIKEIDMFENHQEALEFCTKVLTVKYNWDSKKNIADRFLSLLAKKYNL